MEKIKIFMPHSFLQAVSLLMQCITHLLMSGGSDILNADHTGMAINEEKASDTLTLLKFNDRGRIGALRSGNDSG